MFCRHCGIRLPDGAGFCPDCGAEIETVSNNPAQNVSKQALPVCANAQKQPKGRVLNWLIIAVGILLLVMGLGHLALAAIGKPVSAQVITSEQVLFVNNDDSTRNPSRYKLTYQFSVNGERYTGSVTRVFPGGSQMRKILPVRYLPFWPHVNAEDRKIDPAGPVMLVAGVVLLALGVGKKRRNSNKNQDGDLVERRK